MHQWFFHYQTTGDVATTSAKTLCECPHEDVYLRGVYTIEVCNPPPPWTKGAYAVSLINVQVELVLLFEGDDLR